MNFHLLKMFKYFKKLVLFIYLFLHVNSMFISVSLNVLCQNDPNWMQSFTNFFGKMFFFFFLLIFIFIFFIFTEQ